MKGFSQQISSKFCEFPSFEISNCSVPFVFQYCGMRRIVQVMTRGLVCMISMHRLRTRITVTQLFCQGKTCNANSARHETDS